MVTQKTSMAALAGPLPRTKKCTPGSSRMFRHSAPVFTDGECTRRCCTGRPHTRFPISHSSCSTFARQWQAAEKIVYSRTLVLPEWYAAGFGAGRGAAVPQRGDLSAVCGPRPVEVRGGTSPARHELARNRRCTHRKQICNEKSGSVFGCFRFIWPYNAHPMLLKNSASSRPLGRNGDYSLKWISAAKCAQ